MFCGDNKLGKRFYCIPRVFKPTPSLLYHNNGDGTFTEVSAGTDIQRARGKALGVVATDINGDGLMDLFVANDTVQNFLFANRGKGKWEEIALAAEVGFSANGTPRSGMGVDAADINGDGKQDLFVANVDQEMFSLYRNDGNEFFSDVAAFHGVAQATRLLSGWGLKFFDYDNDGFVDLFLANGHPDDMIESYSQQVRYKEPLRAVPPRRDEALERERAGRPGLPEDVPGARPRGRRLRQRRPDRRPHRQQRRGAGAAQEPRRRRQPLARREAAGHGVQPRRDRRDDHLVGGRHDAKPIQVERRELSLVARHARGARDRRRPRRWTGWRSSGRRPAAASSASPISRSTATSRSSKAKGRSSNRACAEAIHANRTPETTVRRL